LMMGTRSGSIDPGILLFLQQQAGFSIQEVERALNYESGLWGVSGISPDLAPIEAAAAQGNTRAQLAFDLFADYVLGAIGSLAARLGGLDALLFTDRIGEGSAGLRQAVCDRLEFLGLRLDTERNKCVPRRTDVEISAARSAVKVLVIHTREELQVAREAERVVGPS
jgi:acetate kinase